jgi:unsaturated rhamnogalacturonyl hydrolase
MKKTHRIFCLLLIACFSRFALAQPQWSQRAADAAMKRWPDGRFAPVGARWAWNYELGTLLEGFDSVWLDTADGRLFRYIKASVDQFVTPEGTIPTWKIDEYQLDNILLGRQLLFLYGVTLDKRYAKAADLLYEQLKHQPRTPSGGFWHKQRYPNQMWLDGLYMAEPFYADYAATFHHPEAFKDITHQFALIDAHVRDSHSGLLYHGWDESKQERWADRETGLSSQFWARAMGWYMMALVDTLPYYTADDPGRKELLKQLERDASAVAKYQDSSTGLWYQVLDKPSAKGNYLESSASCMFVYALAKSVRRGYLPPRYLANAERGYRGILDHFIQSGSDGDVALTGTVKGAGLGGDPYRDGSYKYYISEKIGTNDPKGVGAFLLASTEMETATNAKLGRGDTVMLDAWYNSQTRADAFGQQVPFHYKWNDLSDSGYFLFGHLFGDFGAETTTLYTAPKREVLRNGQVYIIVSPDIPVKSPNPHYMQKEDADQIVDWVKAGGVLMIMENDSANADLDHLNLLADRFGIHYNNLLRKHVVGTRWDMGKVVTEGGGPIFHDPHTIYVKDVSTISVKPPAVARVTDNGDILVATTKYGKGTVFAMVDPWLYNEYTDGRKLPAEYDNFAAGRELVRWVLEQIPQPRSGKLVPQPAAQRICYPRSYGARGDGSTKDTLAIQSAIDACAKDGGGTVRLSAGTYLSAPIVLKSNITLLLEHGATLLGSPDHADYPANTEFRAPGLQSLVSATDASNIAITGEGTIDGDGESWWAMARQIKDSGILGNDHPRPRLVVFDHCKHVRIEGVTVQNSPMWQVVLYYSDDVVVRNVRVLAPPHSPNTDAVDPFSSSHVVIDHLYADVGDDNVAIKSGAINSPGPDAPAEDISITDCTFLHGHGLSVGSEIAGGARNIHAERIHFDGTDNGIRVKSNRDRGNDVSNLSFRDIYMKNVKNAIVISEYYPKVLPPDGETAKPITRLTPHFHDIVIENLTAEESASLGAIVGLPESPVAGVTLRNVKLSGKQGLTIGYAQVSGTGVIVDALEGKPIVQGPGAQVSLKRLPGFSRP